MNYFKTDILKKVSKFYRKSFTKRFRLWFVQKNIHASGINNFY